MGVTTDQKQPNAQQADTLYDRYGKPLEEKYNGQYVAIAEDGTFRIASSLLQLLQEAKIALGAGNYIFKIGERSVGSLL